MPVHGFFLIQPAHHEDLSCGCWERQLSRLGGMAAALQAGIANINGDERQLLKKKDMPARLQICKEVEKKNEKTFLLVISVRCRLRKAGVG